MREAAAASEDFSPAGDAPPAAASGAGLLSPAGAQREGEDASGEQERILAIQQEFELLASQGEITMVDPAEELSLLMGLSGSARLVPSEQELLHQVQQQILQHSHGESPAGTVPINPAHLSGLTSTDIQATEYDEFLLGPRTTSVPVITGVQPEAAPEGNAESAVTTGQSEAEGAVPEPPSSSADPEGSRESEASSRALHPPEMIHAKPVRAVDAHGLDLTGMDQHPQGGGGAGRLLLWLALTLLVAAAVVLGLIFLP